MEGTLVCVGWCLEEMVLCGWGPELCGGVGEVRSRAHRNVGGGGTGYVLGARVGRATEWYSGWGGGAALNCQRASVVVFGAGRHVRGGAKLCESAQLKKKVYCISHLRERVRERNIYVRKTNRPPPHGPTGDGASNLSVCPHRESNWRPFGYRTTLQPTDPASQDVSLKCWRRRHFVG